MSETYREEWMSDNQWYCAELLEKLFRGWHHVPKIHKYGMGICCNTYSGTLATYDGDMLTRLVFLCHEMKVRAEICSSGPHLVKIALHRRKDEGSMYERHPSLIEAVNDFLNRKA